MRYHRPDFEPCGAYKCFRWHELRYCQLHLSRKYQQQPIRPDPKLPKDFKAAQPKHVVTMGDNMLGPTFPACL
ncbi:hypothetical protein BST61_g3901 [Cercospora zeina]